MTVNKITEQIGRGCNMIGQANITSLPAVVEAIPAGELVNTIATAHQLLERVQNKLGAATTITEAWFPGGKTESLTTGIYLVYESVQGSSIEDMVVIATGVLEDSANFVDAGVHEATIIAAKMAKHLAALTRLNMHLDSVLGTEISEHARTATTAATCIVETSQDYARQLNGGQ